MLIVKQKFGDCSKENILSDWFCRD